MAELAAAAATDPRQIPCTALANPKRSAAQDLAIPAPSNGMDAKSSVAVPLSSSHHGGRAQSERRTAAT